MADVRIIRGFISDPEVLTRHSFNALNRGEKCSIIYSKEKPRTVLSILCVILCDYLCMICIVYVKLSR